MASAVGACGTSSVEVATPASPTTDAPSGDLMASSCARQKPGVGAVRVGNMRDGGAVALAAVGDRSLAYVADADSQAVYTIDLDKKTELAVTRLPGAPAQLLVLADGRVAASMSDKASVIVLEPQAKPEQALVARCARSVGAEPFGLAATPDDASLLVTSAWASELRVLATDDLRTRFTKTLPREPRSVVVDAAGLRAFVSHAVGAELSVVDLTGKQEARKVDMRVNKATPRSRDEALRQGSQGFALVRAELKTGGGAEQAPVLKGALPPPPQPQKKVVVPETFTERVMVPMVTVDPGDPAQRSQAYYGPVADGVGKHAPLVNVVDMHAERSLTKTKVALGQMLGKECLLPRAAAFSKSSQSLFVACAGVDTLVELDSRGPDPSRLEKRRFDVPAGPLGLAIDERNQRAVVWSQFAGKVSVIDLRAGAPAAVADVAVSYQPTKEIIAVAGGRALFHSSDDTRIANDGISCASCHPDGRDDALTWSTPEGPRQTIMLAGRTPDTAPYGWVGKHGDLKGYVSNTLSRLGGRGLREAELMQLVTYLDRLPGPAGELAHSAPLYERGKELFFAEAQGCASCHLGGGNTDKISHDVGTKAQADQSTRFDTPSLKFVARTGPYFHDGRYATLDDMLAATDAEMGHTAHLGRQDREALRVFLEGL